jgi:hypothetical protein
VTLLVTMIIIVWLIHSITHLLQRWMAAWNRYYTKLEGQCGEYKMEEVIFENYQAVWYMPRFWLLAVTYVLLGWTCLSINEGFMQHTDTLSACPILSRASL